MITRFALLLWSLKSWLLALWWVNIQGINYLHPSATHGLDLWWFNTTPQLEVKVATNKSVLYLQQCKHVESFSALVYLFHLQGQSICIHPGAEVEPQANNKWRRRAGGQRLIVLFLVFNSPKSRNPFLLGGRHHADRRECHWCQGSSGRWPLESALLSWTFDWSPWSTEGLQSVHSIW